MVRRTDTLYQRISGRTDTPHFKTIKYRPEMPERTWLIEDGLPLTKVHTLLQRRGVEATSSAGIMIEAVTEGLDAAWRFFGGVPRRLVPDDTNAVRRETTSVAEKANSWPRENHKS